MAMAIRKKLGVIGIATQSTKLVLGLGLELEFGSNSPKKERWMETLAFEEVRASNSVDKPYDSTAFVLHGLLGSGRNWRSFARNLASYLASNSSSGIDLPFPSKNNNYCIVFCGFGERFQEI